MEMIERPLLLLEVRGSNPGHSISKNTTSFPETKRLPGARCVASFPELGVSPGQSKKIKKTINEQNYSAADWADFRHV